MRPLRAEAEPPTDSARIYDAFAPYYRLYSGRRAAYLAGVDDLVCARFAGRVRSLLDFGAGDGVRGAALARRLGAERLVQADVSREMLRLCRALGAAAEVRDVSAPGWESWPDRFDLVLCLWNVLGHVPTVEARVRTLAGLRALLAPGGAICFDVHHRHNRAYGFARVLLRRVVDRLRPDPSRGDVRFDWVVGGRRLPAHGHLFTDAEVRAALAAAGLAPFDRWAVDYETGGASRDPGSGQLLYFAG